MDTLLGVRVVKAVVATALVPFVARDTLRGIRSRRFGQVMQRLGRANP